MHADGQMESLDYLISTNVRYIYLDLGRDDYQSVNYQNS